LSKLEIEKPEWAEDFMAPARYKGIYGGRGGGKSHERAEEIVRLFVQNPNIRFVGLREVQKSLGQSVKFLIESKIEKLGLGHYFDVQQAVIKPKFGDGLMMFQGMQNHTADSIKSLEGIDVAWFEEAQTCSQKSLDLLRPTIRKPNSELWFSWNPLNEDDPIDVLLRGEFPPPGAVVKEVNYDQNPWFPDVLRNEMEYDRRRDLDKYGHIWLGGYQKNSEARIFKNWKVEEFEAPAGTIFSFGADWGSVDPTVLIRSYIVGRTLYVDHEAYEIGCTIDNTPHLFAEIPESDKWPIVADSSNPQMIKYLKDHGFPKIYRAIKGPNSIVEGVDFLKSYDIVVHPRCKHTIQELTLYSYKVDPLTGKVLPIINDKDNHVIDSLRYSHEGARRSSGRPERKPIVQANTVSRWS
jgi:phage terminase large subunit